MNEKDRNESESQEFTQDKDTIGASDTENGATNGSDNMTDGCDTMSGNADNDSESAPDEVAMWKDKYVRLSAEFENYRKRTLKEKLDLISAGGEDIVKSMLEVLDDMDRALLAMENTDDMEAVKQGVVLIDDKLRGILKSKGLAEIEATGEELDADLHEAVARMEVADKEMKGRIIDVVRKGYKLKEKIIRYPKVVVGQ